MADLAKLKNKETLKVLLTLNGEPLMNDPVGKQEPTQMSLTINSPNSQAAREVDFDIQDESIKEYKINNAKDMELDSRKIFEIRTQKMARNTVAWDITMSGKPKLTLDAVVKFYRDYPMFLYQAEEVVNKELGFTLE